MFNNISWTTFLATIAVAIVIYYAAVVALYYRKEMFELLAKLSRRNVTANPEPESGPQLQREFINLMGESKDGHHSRVARITPNFLVKVDQQLDEDQTPDISIIGSVSDLMEGLKALLRAIKSDGNGKDDITAMVPSLLADYAPIAKSKYRFLINTYIHELCSSEYGIDLTIHEVDKLWPGA